jgi:hypothetical protein
MENTASTKTSAIINNITGTFKTMYNHPTGSFATMVFVCFFCSIIIFYVVSSISYDLVDKKGQTMDFTNRILKTFIESSPQLAKNNDFLKEKTKNITDFQSCDITGCINNNVVDLSLCSNEAWYTDNSEIKREICQQVQFKNHYFMGSYNTCSQGDEWQSYVSIETFNKVLETGCRVLDFELYYSEKLVIVATGPQPENDQYYFKGSYNHVLFVDVLTAIDNFIDSNDSKSPLLLNFRIKSNNPAIYKNIEKSLKEMPSIKKLLPDDKYSLSNYKKEENEYTSIGESTLEEQENKIIIILNDNPLNPIPDDIDEYTTLSRLVCLSDTMDNCVVMKSNEIINSHSKENTIEDFRRNIGIALPDWSNVIKNPDFLKHQQFGCQITLMKFSKDDDNLKKYFKYWGKKGKSIVLKPVVNIEGTIIVSTYKVTTITEEQDPRLSPDYDNPSEGTMRDMHAHALREYGNPDSINSLIV